MSVVPQRPRVLGEAGTRVLVVDDDSAITRVLRSMLELDGYTVDEASSGLGLVERVAAAPPALILLDINMPELSGLEVLEGLYRRLGTTVPVIMLSGQTENIALAVDTFKLGAVDYLVKPVAMDKLLATVRSVLGLHRLKRERDEIAARLGERDDELCRLRLEAGELSAKLERTERACAQAQGLIEALAAVVSEGLIVVDESARVRQMNPAAAILTGKRPEDALGRELGEVLGASGPGLDELAELADGPGGGVELVLTRGDAPRRRLRLHAHRHGLAEGAGFVVAMREMAAEPVPTAAPEIAPGVAALSGRSPAIGRIRESVVLAAPAPVLVVGDGGSGKSLVSRLIHELSSRAEHPLLTVDGAELPPVLQAKLLGAIAERESILAALNACRWNRTQAARRLKLGRTTLWRRMRSLGLRPPPA